ncbi:MAG: biotin--[acetyl-CoA-carboxylase] ligase [Elusimicrobiaceae bacterium]|nr:biotin--[acetyl-CoA-carboxylase] ligase [Elusimicrobiaceae bacterium]
MKILGYTTLTSTNTFALEHFGEFEHLNVITANTQTAGKGRKGRKWSSETGGLYFTLIYKPENMAAENLSSLTQIMAISVCKSIKDLGAKAYLKWPNDVLYKGKKFCGILSEAVLENNILKGLVIGVGVNIEQKVIVSDKPFTTLSEMGIKISKTVLIEKIISNFQNCRKENFIEEFKSLCPNFGKEITVDDKTGIFEDMDQNGCMLLKTEKGIEKIIVGDVQF